MPTSKSTRKHGKAADAASDIISSSEDIPEQVHSSNADIQKLRELHEQTRLPVTKKRKVQKVQKEAPPPSGVIGTAVLQAAAESAKDIHKATNNASTIDETDSSPPIRNSFRKV